MRVLNWGGVRVRSVGRGCVSCGVKVFKGMGNIGCVECNWGVGRQHCNGTLKLLVVHHYLSTESSWCLLYPLFLARQVNDDAVH